MPIRQIQNLASLQSAFEGFAPLWSEWAGSSACKLNQSDKSWLDLLRRNDFKADEELDLPEASVVEAITKRLVKQYPDFQQWVTIKFGYCLFQVAVLSGLAMAVKQDLDELTLPADSLVVLKKLKISSLEDYCKTYSKAKLIEKPDFTTIIEFIASYGGDKFADNLSALLRKHPLSGHYLPINDLTQSTDYFNN